MMTTSAHNDLAIRQAVPRRPHRATTSIEVIVALTLMTSALALALPLVVRHGQLLTAHRHYRLALDELTNQLDRLTALPEAELQSAVAELTPSPFAATQLRGAQLSGELNAVDVGQRLTLRLSWGTAQRRDAPVSLSAWIVSNTWPENGEP